MPLIATAAQAAQDKFRVEGHGAGAWIHPYLGTGPKAMAALGDRTPVAGDAYPMLYLVEQDANTSIQTHFHQVDQFQVAVQGEGSLGRHALLPFTVHFSAAFTGYGPLSAGPQGLSYLTVRRAFDPGLRPLPDCRAELDAAVARKPLNWVSKAISLDTPLEEVLVLEPGQQTRSVRTIRLSAQQSFSNDCETAFGDCCCIVLEGELSQPFGLGRLDAVFFKKEEALHLRAAEQGAVVLILSF